MKSSKIARATATLEATEHTVLNLTVASGDPLAPKTTEYQIGHVFSFVKQGEQWILSEDQVFDGLGPAKPDGETVPVPVSPSNPIGPGSHVSPTLPKALTATINRQAVVDYAYSYAANPNPAYRYFGTSGRGGDCTNFISQALRDGGWPDVTGFYRNTTAWWYNSLNQTWTWINADYWWQFAWYRPRVDHAAYVSNLVPADILQIDFDHVDGMDHSMIVTKKDGSGEIYLTYHSTNNYYQIDRSFTSIYNSNPNAWYYGWILRSSYQ